MWFELYVRKHYGKAIEYYKEALAINPNYEQAYINYADALILQGNIENTIVFCWKIITERKDLSFVHYNFGKLFYTRNYMKEVLMFTNENYKKDDRYIKMIGQLSYFIGNEMISRGMTREGIYFFEKSLQADPSMIKAKTILQNLSGK
ncbi:tetratricopeptide repeat protein [Desulfobulbus sp. F3]|nr:tetratricopeptide repeat protein [Desulfobulbus sp. F3]